LFAASSELEKVKVLGFHSFIPASQMSEELILRRIGDRSVNDNHADFWLKSCIVYVIQRQITEMAFDWSDNNFTERSFLAGFDELRLCEATV
jgi:hypothetical protein